MARRTPIYRPELIARAIETLAVELAPSLRVRRREGVDPDRNRAAADLIDIDAPSGRTVTLAVEARRTITPREAEQLVTRDAGSSRPERLAVIVVAPWLSPRTRQVLAESGANYADLTGNMLIRVDDPVIFVRTDGATRDPAPAPRKNASLRGPKTARLVRLLADVRPPYGVRELATAADLAPGYVSRLLAAFDREAVVDRDARGRVQAVDVKGLIRRYAENYDTFSTNGSELFLAARGVRAALTGLADVATPTAVTTSFAANRIAPVAPAVLLTVYCADVAATARALNLRPCDPGGGANVVLMHPFDTVVWQDITLEDGVNYVAPSQAALDCLSGLGRMPSEGEALLDWLVKDESAWRATSLTALSDARQRSDG